MNAQLAPRPAFADALAAYQTEQRTRIDAVLSAHRSRYAPIPRDVLDRQECIDVDQAFHRVARIPPIGNIAQELGAQLGGEEIERAEFDAALDAHAATVPCPSVSGLTRAGEYLNDEVLAECSAPEFSDAETNAMAAELLRVCDEFRCLFAYYHLSSIQAAVHRARGVADYVEE
jgi:hypothetical protein